MLIVCAYCICACVILWYDFLNCKTGMENSQSGMKYPLWPFTVKVGHVKAIDIHLLPKQEPARWSKLAGSSSPPLYN